MDKKVTPDGICCLFFSDKYRFVVKEYVSLFSVYLCINNNIL